MRNKIIFFTVLLVLWIAGCTYFYICKIRMDCNTVQTEIVQGANLVPADTLMNAKSESQLTPPADFTVWFGSGKIACDISGADKNYFSLVKQYLAEDLNSEVLVTGFADNTGSSPVNLKLSTQRAEFIKQQLLDAGIPSENIVSTGKGELDPISENTTADGRAKNRRVEIKTHKN
jgi:outer membrane protein OmpA-like peptidoglycan-associated protein